MLFSPPERTKSSFSLKGAGDFQYKPFLIKTERKNILAFPRNFPISQEIWRPITKMKREEAKFQGYMLGTYPVFDNEYLYGRLEKFPITQEEGVEIYKDVLRRELERAPSGGVLVHIQDLELMDFGDIALEIMEKAWKQTLAETKESIKIHFVTPDQYIDDVLKSEGMESLPELEFDRISWAPEIRLILRADGHYPPLGVTGVGRYDRDKTGRTIIPIFSGKTGSISADLDTLVENFNISTAIPLHGAHFNDTGYDLLQEEADTQVIMCLRIMKGPATGGGGRQKAGRSFPTLKVSCSVPLF